MLQPELDIPLTNVTWKMYLPEEFKYSWFSGNMKLVKGSLFSRTSPSVFSSSNLSGGQQTIDQAGYQQNSSISQYEPYYLEAQARKSKNDFINNVNQQYERYQQYIKKGQTKSVKQGKLIGALPIKVSIPTGGQLITFSKLFSSGEQLAVKAMYMKGAPRNYLLLTFVVLALGALLMFVKHKKEDLSEVAADS